MKKYILSAFAALVCLTGAAQNKIAERQNNDAEIFGAMRSELTRNMNELRVENVGAPFWMGFLYVDVRTLSISASLGELIRSQYMPQKIVGTRVLLGDYSTNSDLGYNGAYRLGNAASEVDGAQIRRDFWLNIDGNYKGSESDMARKIALRRQNARTAEEENLPDMLPVDAIEKTIEGPAFGFDRTEWERRVEELSAVFSEFPSLFGSQVVMNAYDVVDYSYTSEGVKTRQPSSIAMLGARASVRTADGEEFTDALEILATSDLTFPSQDELLARVREFARNLSAYGDAPRFDEFYSGPVLFVGQSVFRMFESNLLGSAGNGLVVKRKPETQQGGQSARRFENRVGQRVLDRRFRVINHSAMKESAGVPLLGYYEIDADGVVPAASMTLIEGGMLKGLLNGRTPTLAAPVSTGSNRFGLSFSPMLAPGTLEITADAADTNTLAELEAQLVALAKADGLKYAYIVEKMNGRVNLVWQLDTATGTRTLVRNAELQPVALTQLKRVAGASSENEVYNFMSLSVPASMIYPQAVLLEDVEIGEMEVPKEKPLPIKNPLERK